MRIVALLAIALLLIHPLVAQAAPSAASAWQHVRVLARFADAAARDAALARHAARVRGAIGHTGFELLELTATSGAHAAAALRAEPGVIAAEPDVRVRINFTPNDPYFASDPYSGSAGGQWGLRKAQVDRAWDVQRGSSTIVVATIDTGIDPGHPDLVGQLVSAPRYVSSPDVSCPVDTTNRDDNGHGTHIAGIVGASGNNGIGIAGVAYGVRLMPIKALDCMGSGFLSDIARAITYAADNGARVVNISLGASDPSAALQSAVAYALSKNVVVIAAAGNCGAESGTTRCPALNATDYPAAYAGAIAVGATDANDLPAAFSTAASYVGVSAPGTSIVSTFPTYRVQLNADGVLPNSYASLRGTSQAAPFVAGVAALLLSKEPTLAPEKVAERLRTTADDVGAAGYDIKSGDGRVNAYRAITGATKQYGAQYQLQPPTPTTLAFASTATIRLAITNSSTFMWPAAGATAVHVSTHWFKNTGELAVWDGPRASFAADVPAGGVAIVDVPVSAPVPRGSYVLKVDLVQEGVSWFSAQGVAPLSLSIAVNGGYGATYQTQQTSAQILIGAASTIAVTVTNTGTRTWPAIGPAPVRLGSHLREQTGKLLLWDGPRTSLGADVIPGASATIALALPQPSAPGSYVLELDLVQESVLWFSSEGVATKTLAASASTGYAARYAIAAPPQLLPGERVRLSALLTNGGAFAWSAAGANPVRLASHVFDAKGALVRWDGARATLAADVAPADSAQTTLIVDAPATPGAYVLRVDLVREGLSWFSTQGVTTLDLPLTIVSDRRGTLTFSVTSVSRSALLPVAVTVRNASSVALSSEGANPVNVSSHWVASDGKPLLWDGPRVALPRVLLPGESANVSLVLGQPPAGASALVVDLVQEGIGWFGAGSAVPVTVTP